MPGYKLFVCSCAEETQLSASAGGSRQIFLVFVFFLMFGELEITTEGRTIRPYTTTSLSFT